MRSSLSRFFPTDTKLKARIRFTLRSPQRQGFRGNRYANEMPAVTVAGDRSLKAIVADVNKRMLPKASMVYAQCMKEIERAIRSKERTDQMNRDVAKLMGVPEQADNHYRQAHGFGEDGFSVKWHTEPIYEPGTQRTMGQRRVFEFDVRVYGLEEARRFVEAVKALQTTHMKKYGEQ